MFLTAFGWPSLSKPAPCIHVGHRGLQMLPRALAAWNPWALQLVVGRAEGKSMRAGERTRERLPTLAAWSRSLIGVDSAIFSNHFRRLGLNVLSHLELRFRLWSLVLNRVELTQTMWSSTPWAQL